jgi:alcohol dehydrogenase class IV
MDALSHNLEAYCAPGFHPMAEGIAVEGMRLVKDYLPRAVADGNDLEARSHMLVASSMGATAFQKGLGAMHSLSHPCSANLGTHHGLTNAVVMPYVLEWNREVLEDKMGRLAAWLALEEKSFAGVLRWVLELRRAIGIPPTLAALGLDVRHAKPFAPQALADPSTGGNPVPMTERCFETLYLRCIRGELATTTA